MYTTTYQDAFGQLHTFSVSGSHTPPHTHPTSGPSEHPSGGSTTTMTTMSQYTDSPSSWSVSDRDCTPSAPPLASAPGQPVNSPGPSTPRRAVFDARILEAQIGMSDEEAVAAALANDRAERERREQQAQEQQEQLWHAPHDEHQLANDALLARALAEEDAAFRSIQARSGGGEIAASNPMYPEMLGDDGRDMLISRRLSQVPQVALQPRVNGSWRTYQPPISEDRARLMVRLDEYGLVERQVKGDGACQFRSLSDQLYGNPEHHDVVRRAVVLQLSAHPDWYSQHVPTTFRSYCHDMSQPHTWGDHVTLKAASDHYGIRIIVLTSFKDNFVLAIEPREKKSSRVLWLSFWAEVHYNSIYPREEPPGAYPSVPKVLGSKQLGRLFMG